MKKHVGIVTPVLLAAVAVLVVICFERQVKNERTHVLAIQDKLPAENGCAAELQEKLHIEIERVSELQEKLHAENQQIAELQEKLHVESRRAAELKDIFRVFEWPVTIRKKSMVYVYGSTAENPRPEVDGGIGITPQSHAIYIWPGEQGCMCLSVGTGSYIPFPHETYFRPVMPLPELVTGKTIRLLDGQGPSQGKSLWIRIVELPDDPAQ